MKDVARVTEIYEDDSVVMKIIRYSEHCAKNLVPGFDISVRKDTLRENVHMGRNPVNGKFLHVFLFFFLATLQKPTARKFPYSS